MVRLPYSPNNKSWLRLSNTKPVWESSDRCWSIPKSWLDELVQNCLLRFSNCYVVSSISKLEKCAPACWRAEGVECECSCFGEFHGQQNSNKWFVVDDYFAYSSSQEKYSIRLLKSS